MKKSSLQKVRDELGLTDAPGTDAAVLHPQRELGAVSAAVRLTGSTSTTASRISGHSAW